MKTILYSIALLSGINSFAQTPGELIKKELSSFSRISVGGETTVYLKQTSQPYISMQAGEEKGVSYELKDDQLTINGAGDAIYVGIVNLSSIKVEGTSDVYGSDTLKSEVLSIACSGAGDINLLLNCGAIDCAVTGASDVKLAGRASDLNAQVSGSGDLLAQRLWVKRADLKISGAGDAKVNVRESLKGQVSGSGTLYYMGDVQNVDVSVTGSGSMKQLNKLDDSDTTRISLGNREIIILDKSLRITDKDIADEVLKGIDRGMEQGKKSKPKKSPINLWSGFELGINGWLNADGTTSMDSMNSNFSLNYGKSIVVNFNLWEVRAKLIGNNLTLVSGLGAEINNYRFDKNIRMSNPDDKLTLVNESEVNYLKSKFTTGYLNAPLYLSIATNPIRKGKRLFIAPGITGGWRFTSYNKRKVEIDGDESKSRFKNDFNTMPFRVNASLRMGYGNFLLFANYSLTEFFRKDLGPGLIPFSVGVRVIGFGG
jgi:hypothetical protein